jgi:endonuclease YncB( thermonuclease family)
MQLATDFGDIMIERISLATISLCIAACASSAPEAPAPAVTGASAGADAVMSETTSADPEGLIEESDAPVVHATAAVMEADDSDTIVCRRERQTGSKMTVRVCRTRAEIEERAEKDQEILRNSRATQSGGSCALNQSC